jgi:hypothetical protein
MESNRGSVQRRNSIHCTSTSGEYKGPQTLGGSLRQEEEERSTGSWAGLGWRIPFIHVLPPWKGTIRGQEKRKAVPPDILCIPIP